MSLERKFCGSCFLPKPTEGGVMKPTTNRSKRWVCQGCAAKLGLRRKDNSNSTTKQEV